MKLCDFLGIKSDSATLNPDDERNRTTVRWTVMIASDRSRASQPYLRNQQKSLKSLRFQGFFFLLRWA